MDGGNRLSVYCCGITRGLVIAVRYSILNKIGLKKSENLGGNVTITQPLGF